MLSLVGTGVISGQAIASESQITATIAGLKNQDGRLCLTLFAQESGFPSSAEAAIAAQCVQANQADVGITFANLRPGNYAIAVFHDANDDGKLNTGFLGIPKEGFGFSRNPRIATRAPRFQEAAFSLTRVKQQVQIQMKYF